jgi:hypothetical protein
MDLTGMLKKVSDAKDKLMEAGLVSPDTVNYLLQEYKLAISVLQACGLRVGKCHVSVGVLPEITTSIVGSVDYLEEKRIAELLQANHDKKLLTAILSALQTVAHIRQVVDLSSLQEVTINVTLGIPPRISVELSDISKQQK